MWEPQPAESGQMKCAHHLHGAHTCCLYAEILVAKVEDVLEIGTHQVSYGVIMKPLGGAMDPK